MLEKLKIQIQLVFHGPYDTSVPEGRDLERSRNIALTALTAMMAKAVSMIIPLITLRITLSYLGEETYGLWTTVTTFFALFTYADLGLGSGLQTELSHASALQDRYQCRKMVSTTYTILFGVSVALLVLLAAVYPYVNWASIVNAQTTETIQIAGSVVLAILVPKLINIPLAIIQRTQNAMQEGYRTNLWQICGNVLSLLFVVVVSIIDGGKILMIFLSSVVVVIVAFFNMLFYFGKQRPELKPSIRLFDVQLGKQLLKTGIAFFILSIFTSLGLSIDNWVVAKISSLSEVTPYSIMLRLANMVNVVSLMLSTPMWSANGEALERGEYDWIRRKTRSIAKFSTLLSIVCSIGILVLCKPALYILTNGTVQADYSILVGMCCLNILISFTSPFFMVLNGARIVRFQIGNYIIYSFVSLSLKFILGNMCGVRVVPWVGAFTYFILLTIPTVWRAKKALGSRYGNC